MTMTLIDWSGEKYEFDIGNLDDILMVDIKVITGDEIAHVVYKDGHEKMFDSGFVRLMDFFDYEYTIYDYKEETNWMFAENFLTRKTSYDMEKVISEEDTRTFHGV